MDLEDCILLREEAVDSNSLNRCITNIFNFTKELASDSVAETSENYPDSPFYKNGCDNALTSEKYSIYNLTGASQLSSGVVRRTYSGPLNINVYRKESLSSNSATGFYEYGMDTVVNEFVPTVETLYSPTYPLVFSSLLGSEEAGPFVNGTCTIESNFLPTVKYTSYLLCSGFGVSFGTITFSANDGMTQENVLQIDVTNDLIHMQNVDEIKFVGISNGYGSGVKRISENMDMVEDVCSTEITYLDKSHNSILLKSITKNDASESIRIDKSSGRILEDDEDAEYGTYVKLDNSEYSLNFFVVFTYTLPDVAFDNNAIGLGQSNGKTSFVRFQQNISEIDGTPLTLPKFKYLDTYDNGQLAANEAKDVESAFENSENAVFPVLEHISNVLRNGKNCFKGCKSATFESLSSISLAKAISVESMFEGCISASFDALSSVALPMASRCDSMFYGCANSKFGNLETLKICGDSSRMFFNCPKATFAKLGTIDGNAANMTEIFRGCDNATFKLLASIWSGYNGQTNAASAFIFLENATFDALTTLGMGNLGYSSQSMFEGCKKSTFSSLASIKGTGADTYANAKGPVDARRMFYGCTKGTFSNLHSLGDLLKNSSEMFRECENLNLNITDTLNSLNSAGYMFAGSNSVTLATLGRSLYDGEGIFEGASSVTIKSFGDRTGTESPMNANMVNAFKNAENVSISGDVFANNSDMYGMFDTVGVLSLDSTDSRMLTSDENTACRRMDYMFRNVTSPSVFVKYGHSIFPKNLESASYMFYNVTRNLSDGIFGVDVNGGRGIERILSRVVEGSTVTVDTLRESNVSDVSYMFTNRHMGGEKATRLFRNVEYVDSSMPEYSQYSMHIPHAAKKADGMYENVTVGGNASLTSAIVMIPPTLTSANRMFYHSAELSSSGIPMAFASTTDSPNYKGGTVYFSDKLADNHTDWMKGARFASMRGNDCDLTLSVKNLSSDYFEGSDFTFDCFSHIIDRSGVYWSDGNKNYTFFCGNSENPRETHFSGLKDDISKWFTEGCEFANILAPYSSTDAYGYTLRKDTSSQLPDGISKTFMKIYNSEIEQISQYTNDVDLDSLSGLDGDNMTCMFCLPMLSKYSTSLRYYKSDGAPAEYTNNKNYSDARVYGNNLYTITTSANRSSTDKYCDNDSYSNATFKGLKHISSVNMPFAFYNLQSATFENVTSIGGNIANAVCAFSNCKNATFSNLSSIRINAKYTNDSLSSNSFVSSTKNTEWNNLFYRMFDGCDMATFEKLSGIYVNGISDVVMSYMFRDSGLAHIPNVDITANGVIRCGGKSFSRYIADNASPSISIKLNNGESSSSVTFDNVASLYLKHKSDDTEYGIPKFSLKKYNSTSNYLTSVFTVGVPSNVTSVSIPCSCNMYNSNSYEYFEIFGMLTGGGYVSIAKYSGTGNKEANWTASGNSLSSIKIVHYCYGSYAKDGVIIPHIKLSSEGNEYIFRNFKFAKDGTTDIMESKGLKAEQKPVNYTGNLFQNDHISIRGSSVNAASGFSESASELSSVSVLAGYDIYSNFLFSNSKLDFSDGASIVVSSENGTVDAKNMFSGCYNSDFGSLSELKICQSELAEDSNSYPARANMGVSRMFENCPMATLENLSSLYLLIDYKNNFYSYSNMFDGCTDSLNLSSLSLSTTNIHRLGYNNTRTNGTKLFSGVVGIGEINRSSVIENLRLDSSIACCMDWNSYLSSERFEDCLQSYDTASILKNVPTLHTNFRYVSSTSEDLSPFKLDYAIGGFKSFGVISTDSETGITLSGFPEGGTAIAEIYAKFYGNTTTNSSASGNALVHRSKSDTTVNTQLITSSDVVTGSVPYRYTFKLDRNHYDDWVMFSAKTFNSSYGVYLYGLRILSNKDSYVVDGVDWHVVEYIDNNYNGRGAVIDTLYFPCHNTTVKFNGILFSTNTECGYFGCKGLGNWFGVKNQSTDNRIVANVGAFQTSYVTVTKGIAQTNTVGSLTESDNISEIILDANAITSNLIVNNRRAMSSNLASVTNYSKFRCTKTMALFALHSSEVGDEYSNISKVRLYGCEIWESNILKRKFIPVRRVYGGTYKYALYESVEGKIYESVTNVDFTGGGEY